MRFCREHPRLINSDGMSLHKEQGKSMATINKEIDIRCSGEFAWDAIRDVGNIHKRLVPGFVTDCVLEDGARTVTFDNGMVIRELIVDVDDETRRHAWATHDKPFVHYNASVQVFANGPGKCRVAWLSDFLPHELRETMEQTIQRALDAMKRTMEREQSTVTKVA